jgi:hypothetical protein
MSDNFLEMAARWNAAKQKAQRNFATDPKAQALMGGKTKKPKSAKKKYRMDEGRPSDAEFRGEF